MRFRTAVELRSRGYAKIARAALLPRESVDLEHYATADVVVSGGGTYLVDHYDLRPRIFDYHTTLALGRPLVFFTQSLRPFRNQANRRALRPIFEAARLILLRDGASADALRELGVANKSVHVCADSAFALYEPNAPAERAKPVQTLRVAISVRKWTHFQDSAGDAMGRFVRGMAAGVAHLIRTHGATVEFVSTCQGIPEYWFNDADVAEEIVALLPA
jgi:colanic acid/amylovoran biosynthesis protein